MISMASRADGAERRAIAQFVTGKSLSKSDRSTTPPPQAMCARRAAPSPTRSTGTDWNGWGDNTSNTRFQDGAAAGFTAAEVPRLKVKWAFGFPGDLDANAQPTIVGGRVFVGSQGGKVYSLSAGQRLHPLVRSSARAPCAAPSPSAGSTTAAGHATRRSSAT